MYLLYCYILNYTFEIERKFSNASLRASRFVPLPLPPSQGIRPQRGPSTVGQVDCHSSFRENIPLRCILHITGNTLLPAMSPVLQLSPEVSRYSITVQRVGLGLQAASASIHPFSLGGSGGGRVGGAGPGIDRFPSTYPPPREAKKGLFWGSKKTPKIGHF